MNLTPKQERFAQEVAAGKSQAEAYRLAFNVKPTTKPETSVANASRLMADSNVSARVADLKAQLSEKALWTREESVKVLREIASKEDAEAKPTDRVAAVKALNAMHGYDAATQINLNGNMVHRIQREIVDDANPND